MASTSLIPPILGLLFAPLLLGVVRRTKARMAGRTGEPLLQAYYDLWKLLHKGAVYSKTTTVIFRAGPVVSLAAMITALFITPLGGIPAPLTFAGDMILFAGLMGLGRFATVLSALDTGSSFEGMGASREVQYASLCEPAFYLGLVVLAQCTQTVSLGGALSALSPQHWGDHGMMLILAAATFFTVFLAENSRIPFDDPNTHLELTMVHEVMVLDHGGPDFAFISYGAALKLWMTGSIVAQVLLPLHSGSLALSVAGGCAGMVLLGVCTGLVESTMARLRLLRVPQLLVGALAMSVLALALGLMR